MTSDPLRDAAGPIAVCLKTSTKIHGGVWRHVLELATGLRERGHLVRVDVPPELREEVADLGLSGSSRPRSEVLHLHLGHTHDLASTAALVLARARGRQVVITEHLPRTDASDPALASRRPRPGATLSKTALKRLQYALAAKVIVLSSGSAEFVDRRYRPRPGLVDLVPNGVRPAEVVAPLAPRPCPRFVATGSLIAQKGFDLLIDAAGSARRDWVVDIFGVGPHLEELRARSAFALTTDGSPRLRFRGWSDEVDLELRRADAVVLPSRWEAMPYSALEAMAYGRPVIATAVDGLSDLVVDGRTGYLVKPCAADLRAALDAFSELAEPEVTAMGLEGRSRVLQHFTLDGMIDQTVATYRSLRPARSPQ